LVLVLLSAGSLLMTACGSGGSSGSSAPGGKKTATTTTSKSMETAATRPPGPASALAADLHGGNGTFVGSAAAGALDSSYEERELSAAGTATAYEQHGERTPDGRWTFTEGDKAHYRTRIIVRQPKDPARASGIVLLEWLNVSGGVDADPEFASLREEIVRAGHTWVGVSAQAIGIEGGPVAVKVDVPGADAAGKGLKALDPARYGSLDHPGDAYAYDIYTQIARAVREGLPGGSVPEHVVAVGESQSAFALVTYINGVQPLTKAFDGFFVHSRGGSGLALVPPGQAADIAGSLGGPASIVRTDTDVPIMDIQAETDVAGLLGSVAARQPDTAGFRLWEVPGTAHADVHLIGEANAAAFDCGVPINDGPFHLVAKAAFHHFVTWVDGGNAPPKMPRLELTDGDAPDNRRDDDGIAMGGVRTPPVDVPTRILSGEKGPSSDVICLLSGSTKPMAAARLAERYPTRAAFQEEYDRSVARAIKAGAVLADDRAALEAYAHPELVEG
jgi:hypothetical protein